VVVDAEKKEHERKRKRKTLLSEKKEASSIRAGPTSLEMSSKSVIRTCARIALLFEHRLEVRRLGDSDVGGDVVALLIRQIAQLGALSKQRTSAARWQRMVVVCVVQGSRRMCCDVRWERLRKLRGDR
jgi:hypothetical protein